MKPYGMRFGDGILRALSILSSAPRRTYTIESFPGGRSLKHHSMQSCRLAIGHLFHEEVWLFHSMREPAALRLIYPLEGEAPWNQQITSF